MVKTYNDYYTHIFGKDNGKSLYKSYECYYSPLINYPFNAVSSFSYIFLSLYLFNLNLNLLLFTGGNLYLLLGIASFFWWSCQKKQIQIIDNILYSCAFIWTGIYITYINLGNHYDKLLTIIFIILSIIVYNSRNNAVLLKKINVLSVIYIVNLFLITIYKTKDKQLINSFCLLSMGVIYKLNDFILKFKFGTCIFHILTSLGIFYLV